MLKLISSKVYEACKRIPRGKVVSYKQIGEFIGSRAYRAIGTALSKNESKEVPCHRVVGSDGSLVGFKGQREITEKEKILREEGVEIVNGKVLKEYFVGNFSTRKVELGFNKKQKRKVFK